MVSALCACVANVAAASTSSLCMAAGDVLRNNWIGNVCKCCCFVFSSNNIRTHIPVHDVYCTQEPLLFQTLDFIRINGPGTRHLFHMAMQSLI